MGVLPRRLIKQNLNLVEVFLQDDNNEFIVVQDLADTFGQGRSSFKVFGSDFLKQGVKLRAEILDSAGTPIFITPVTYRYNGGLPTLPYTYFTVEVYSPPINVGGKAELIILGELDNEKINVPQEFVGRYNVKFRKTINIDVAKTINDAPILFYKKPSITTTEIVKKRLVPRGSNTTITRVISGSGISGFPLNAGDRYYPDPSKIVEGTIGETPPNTDTTDTQEETSTIKEAPGGDFTELVNLKSFKTGEVRTPKILAKANKFELFSSEEPPTMKIFSTGSLFTSDMVGGEIRIPSQSIIVYNPKQYIGEGNVGIGTGFQTFPAKLDLAAGPELEGAKIFIPDYTASIERVVNDKEIHVKEPFWFQYGVGADAKYYLADFGNHPYAPIDVAGSPRADFFMSFIETTTAETSSFAFDSFLDFNIKNLRTFSGDVYRLRVSGGSKTQISDFPILLDTVLESPQLLIDSDSPSGVLRTGYIQSQAHITKYWESSANLTPSFNSTELIDAVKLSGSLSQKNDVGRFSLKSAYNFEVNKDVVYTLSMRIVGKKGIKVQSDDSITKSAKIKFHVSGSNISPDNNPKYTEPNSFGGTIRDEYGNVVGLELNGESAEKVDYGKISHTFKIPFKKSRVTNLDTIFQVRVESGEWFLSDISLRPALDTGFSPDNVLVRVPIPINSQRPDKFQFILQYYDVNNNEAEEVTLVDDVDVEGQSLLIQGDDNLLKGTLSIGNVQGKGVEMVGGNSAFIRAIGYTGFKDARAGSGGGFFMWSGSVTPGGETQDNYNGAGLEIHDGNTGSDESFFKFRTDDADNANNSTFDLKTSRFFLGGGGQFISGSLGNIEISSSNFHLQNDGDVVMQGTITAEAGGTIGGFSINANDLTGGSGASTIKLASGIGIHLGNTNLASAPFSVTNAGVLKAESGTIGGYTLGETTLTGGKLILRNDGTIESSDFATNVAGSGFRLTANDGGFLEVENAKIRGTLATAVFEKESVNAVGGQLYVANSTVLTGSSVAPGGLHTASQTTMSVQNVTGFVTDEILAIKKVDSTGFSTEYVKVRSASRAEPSSETNLSGNLIVTRGLGNGTTGDSGSLGDSPSAGQAYSGSQVIVSTGRKDTGYIRLNANPNDTTTPYMDIIERTGSGIYDVDLKARLGDLSGLSQARLQGTDPANAGFGLYSQNVFLEGGIIAKTGSIGGISMENNKLFIGAGTFNNSNTSFFADNSGNFSLGDKLVWNGSNLSVNGSITISNAGSIDLSDFNNDSGFTDDTLATTASSSAANAQTRVGTIEGKVVIGGSSVSVQQDSNNKAVLTTSGVELFQGGNSVADFGSTIIIGSTSTEHIKITSSGLQLKDGNTTRVSMSSAGVQIGNNVSIDASGDATFSGNLSAAGGTFAGTLSIGGSSVALSSLNTDSTADIRAGTTAANVGLGNVENKDSQTQAQDGLISGVTLTGGGITIGSGGSIKSSGKDNLADNTAGFFLGHDGSSGYDFAIGNASQFMKFDGSAGTLSVAGTISISNPGDIDISDLNNDSGFTDDTAANNAQNTANTANTAASNAQSTANTANSTANSANTTANNLATQVVLNSGGMDLKNAAADTTLASYGTTTTIGVTSTEHVEITSTSLKIKDGSTTRLEANSSGLRVGREDQGVRADADGNVTLTGTLFVGGNKGLPPFTRPNVSITNSSDSPGDNAWAGSTSSYTAQPSKSLFNENEIRITANNTVSNGPIGALRAFYRVDDTALTPGVTYRLTGQIYTSNAQQFAVRIGASSFSGGLTHVTSEIRPVNSSQATSSFSFDFKENASFSDRGMFFFFNNLDQNSGVDVASGDTWTFKNVRLYEVDATGSRERVVASLGGFAFDGNSMFSGTKKIPRDNSPFTSEGSMTIGAEGFIAAPSFSIQRSGDAQFKGKLLEEALVESDAGSFQAFSGTSTSFVRDIGAAANVADNGFSCVLRGTKIITKRGEIKIEDTKQDDLIKVYDWFKKEWGYSPIKQIKNRVTKEGWSHIKTKKGYELKCSNSHLLYHPEYPGHAIAADELGIGGQLYVVQNQTIIEDNIESIKIYDEPIEVWNYSLEYTHNYISNGILSHNDLPKLFFTGFHNYFVSSSAIQSGDAVKLDEDNCLQLTTQKQDSSCIGIAVDTAENLLSPALSNISNKTLLKYLPVSSSIHLDSFGRSITDFPNHRLLRVASLGDTRNFNTTLNEATDMVETGSVTLTGFKICNQGGLVSKGDLLCTSDTAGYLMKQPSEYVITSFSASVPQYEERQNINSFTVGKVMESCSFDESGKVEGVYGYLYCG